MTADLHHLIPMSDAAKARTDPVVLGTSLLGFLKLIPWPEIAAFLACVYTALRIVEIIVGWRGKKR